MEIRAVTESIHPGTSLRSLSARVVAACLAALIGFVLMAGEVHATPAAGTDGNADTPQPPSAAYPFASKYVRIDGHRIHYVEEGPRDAKTIIFVHGNPTWSYSWRNILPGVARQTHRRAIALDMLGMGLSDKPPLDYTPQLQSEVLARFIRKLNLRDVILVGHDWGGAIATGYAVNHAWNVDGLILMETLAWTYELEDLGPFVPFLHFTRSPEGQATILNDDRWYYDNVVKSNVVNQAVLTEAVEAGYLRPYPTPESRRAMAQFFLLVPVADDPLSVPASLQFFNDIEAKRASLSNRPLLLIRTDPGALITELSIDKFDAFASVITDVEVKEFGSGLHFPQEEDPAKLNRLISEWVIDKGLAGRRHRR